MKSQSHSQIALYRPGFRFRATRTAFAQCYPVGGFLFRRCMMAKNFTDQYKDARWQKKRLEIMERERVVQEED